jgi:hypothetical protein
VRTTGTLIDLSGGLFKMVGPGTDIILTDQNNANLSGHIDVTA